MKNIFFIVISLSFSLIHAQFVSRSEVMSQIDVFLQKDVDETDSSHIVYEILGAKQLQLMVDASVEEFDGRYILQFYSESRKAKLHEESELRNFAVDDLKRIFGNDVFRSSKITRVGFEYQQRNGVSEIVGGVVMISQLLQERPIRGNAFIFMFYDAYSKLKRIEYRWLQTKKKVVRNVLRSADVKQSHKNVLENKILEINDDLIKEKIHGELYKAVQSWRLLIDSTGKEILTPSITYLGLFDDAGITRYISFDVDVFSGKAEKQKNEICSSKGDE